MPPVINPLTLNTSVSPTTSVPTSIPIFNVGIDPSINTVQNELLQNSMANVFGQYLNQSTKENSNTLGDIYSKGVNASRYPNYNPDLDNEEAYAKSQSLLDKAVNGTLKGLGLATTSFINGTAGLIYGLGAMISQQRAAAFFDNDLSAALSKWDKSLEDRLPNYYTNAETNADAFSKENILSFNFVFDKLVKNAGFTLGSMGAGVVWGTALKVLSAASGLSKVGASVNAFAIELEAAQKITDPVARLAKINAAVEGANTTVRTLAQMGAKSAFNNGNRLITAAFGTFGEAGIEAHQATADLREKLINEYKQNNFGQSPSEEELKRINETADAVGKTVFALESVALMASNYIQLPKILGSKYSTSKLILNGVERETAALAKNASTGLAEEAITQASRFQKLYNKGKKVGSYLFSPTEMSEEGSQFIISQGASNYFEQKYKNNQQIGGFFEELGGWTASEQGLKEGVKQLFNTKEGQEAMLLGGLSGGLMQLPGTISQNRKQKANTAAAIEALNKTSFGDVLKDNAATQNAAINITNKQVESVKNNDKKGFKDAESDCTFNYLQSRIKYGKTAWVEEDIKQYKQQASTEEGFEQLKAQGLVHSSEEREAFIAKISKFENDVKFLNGVYKDLNVKYARSHSEESIDALAYLQYKMQDADRRTSDMFTSSAKKGLSVQNLFSELQTNNFSKEAFTNVENQIEALNIPEEDKVEITQTLVDVLSLQDERKAFLNDYNIISKNPQVFDALINTFKKNNDSSTETEEAPTENKPKVKITSQDGEEELEIGKTYNVILTAKNKFDEEFSGERAFSIVKENEDGTLLIRNLSGKEEVIDKEVLKKYKIGDYEQTRNNKTAAFLSANLNTVFGMYLKGGYIAEGRLRWHGENGKLLYTFIDPRTNTQKTIVVTGADFKAVNDKQAKLFSLGKISREQADALNDFTNSEELANQEHSLLQEKETVVQNLVNEYMSQKEANSKKIADLLKELETINDELLDI